MTTTQTAAPTKEDLPVIIKTITPAVDALLIQMAYTEAVHEKIDPIKNEVLREMQIYTDPTYLERECLGAEPKRLIGNPEHLYLANNEDAQRYYDRMHHEYINAGFDVKPNYCPVLIAESDQRECEFDLIDTAYRFFGIKNNDLLLGANGKGGVETRREYIDLLIKMVVNSPNYQAPEVK